MNTVRISRTNEFINSLWGSTLTKLEHNMLNHSIKFYIKCNLNDKDENFIVEFVHINNLDIRYEKPEREWDYVELTSIDIENICDKLEINCDFWSVANIIIICNDVICFKSA
jgi:sugar diacid utilization regulator